MSITELECVKRCASILTSSGSLIFHAGLRTQKTHQWNRIYKPNHIGFPYAQYNIWLPLMTFALTLDLVSIIILGSQSPHIGLATK